MSPVKIIHVLKRLEILDRDIQELRELEETLSRNRSYSDALKISVELQINGLLNERVKLMELRIENAPEHLIPSNREIQEPSRKLVENRSKFSFKDLEEDYLDRILQKRNQNQQSKTLEVKGAEITAEEFDALNQEDTRNLGQDEVDALVEKTSQKKNVSNSPSKADILKKIPKVQY